MFNVNEFTKGRAMKTLQELYQRALEADDVYSRVCKPYGGRWKADKKIADVQMAYRNKVKADREWLDALEIANNNK